MVFFARWGGPRYFIPRVSCRNALSVRVLEGPLVACLPCAVMVKWSAVKPDKGAGDSGVTSYCIETSESEEKACMLHVYMRL